MENLLAVIPARGGSKGIINKNIKDLNGKPLIYYTLERCKALFKDDRILVTSDSQTILEYCESLKISSSYRRPESLSADETPMIDTVLHAVDWYNSKFGNSVTDVIVLQPTSPLRQLGDLVDAIGIYMERKLKSLVSVSPLMNPPEECIKLSEDENWEYILKDKNKVEMRQKYKNNFFWIDGSIYINSIEFAKKNKSFLVPGETFPFITSDKYNIDIDHERDFDLVKAILSYS